MKPEISVIIPVYNTALYLKDCLDSVIGQSFENWEAIVVDDGSTDESPHICDSYAAEDERIHVYHTVNGGLSVARNVGISKASGHYLFFLDSDDYLPKNSFEDLYNAAERAGFPIYIKGNHRVLLPEGGSCETKFSKSRLSAVNQRITPPQSHRFLSQIILIHPMVWNGLMDRQYLIANELMFEKNAWPREDLVFHLKWANLSFTGIYTPEQTYVYRLTRNNSLSNSVSKRHLRNSIEIARFLAQYYHHVHDEEIRRIVMANYEGTIMAILRQSIKLPLQYRKQILSELSKENLLETGNLSGVNLLLLKLFRLSPFAYTYAMSLPYALLPKRMHITK